MTNRLKIIMCCEFQIDEIEFLSAKRKKYVLLLFCLLIVMNRARIVMHAKYFSFLFILNSLDFKKMKKKIISGKKRSDSRLISVI